MRHLVLRIVVSRDHVNHTDHTSHISTTSPGKHDRGAGHEYALRTERRADAPVRSGRQVEAGTSGTSRRTSVCDRFGPIETHVIGVPACSSSRST